MTQRILRFLLWYQSRSTVTAALREIAALEGHSHRARRLAGAALAFFKKLATFLRLVAQNIAGDIRNGV